MAAGEYIRRTPSAHGQDVVTVIITDFRGIDTLGEITVLLITAVEVATLNKVAIDKLRNERLKS